MTTTTSTATKIFCIVNPASGDFSCGKKWPAVERQLRAAVHRHHRCGMYYNNCYYTQRTGHAAQLAHGIRQQEYAACSNKAKSSNIILVVVAGGDGTVHEVASALRGTPESSSLLVTLGIIPMGTANDVAMAHGIWNVPTAIEILQTGVDRMCGAWRVEGYPAAGTGGVLCCPQTTVWDGEPHEAGRVVRWAFDACDAGITSDMGRAKLRRAKWIRGPKKYTYLGLTTIPLWKRRRVQVTVDDNEVQCGSMTLFAATTGSSYGGGYHFVPHMYPQRPTGSFMLAGYLSRVEMLLLMRQLRKCTHLTKPGILVRDANQISLRPMDDRGNVCNKPIIGSETFVQVDGEPMLQLPVSLSWHLDQIKIRGARVVNWE